MTVIMYQIFDHYDVRFGDVEFCDPQDFPPEIPSFCQISFAAKFAVPDWYDPDDSRLFFDGCDPRVGDPVAYIYNAATNKKYRLKLLSFTQKAK